MTEKAAVQNDTVMTSPVEEVTSCTYCNDGTILFSKCKS